MNSDSSSLFIFLLRLNIKSILGEKGCYYYNSLMCLYENSMYLMFESEIRELLYKSKFVQISVLQTVLEYMHELAAASFCSAHLTSEMQYLDCVVALFHI